MSFSPSGPIDRIPPQSLEMEMAVLGSMITNPSKIDYVSEVLTTDDFYRKEHRMVFSAIMTMAANREAVDLYSLNTHLAAVGALEHIGGAPFLVTLTQSLSTTAHLPTYVKAVENCSAERRLIAAAAKIDAYAYDAYSENITIEDAMEEAEREVLAVAQRHVGQDMRPMSHLVAEMFDDAEERSNNPGSYYGIRTGLTSLDAITSGFQPSDLVIIAARPSLGKTALATGIAAHVSMKEKQTVAFFSYEMSGPALTKRLACSLAKVDSSQLRQGAFSALEWDRFGKACGILAPSTIYIEDNSSCSLIQMRGKCRRLKAAHGLGLIVVDYLQLMPSTGKKVENRVQEVAALSRGLKMIAKEFDVPVIALCQCSRAVEQRENKKPMLSDLRESGALEADADIVIMLHRPSVYAEVAPPPVETISLIVAKHRNGPTGTVDVGFESRYARFVNLASPQQAAN